MAVPTLVLSFGHSVLTSLEDYTRAAGEVYRHYRRGYNVVVVASAQGDATDVMMAEARRVGPEDPTQNAENLSALIGLGERRSAALLALALERIGAPAFIRQARDIGLKAEGAVLEAEPVSLDKAQLLEDLKNHDIVVAPGYVAINENDRQVLLGQGGADLTALFIAEQLGCEAILLKDVPGVFERDPAEDGPPPALYERVDWDTASRIARILVEPKAIQFAKSKKFEFEVGMPGWEHYTRIGRLTTDSNPFKRRKPLRVAMLGAGHVGGGVYRRFAQHPDEFQMVKILVRDKAKYVLQGIDEDILTTNADDLLAAKPDVFVDVGGGTGLALDLTKAMIDAGVHVVSANKQAIAAGGPKLEQRAADKGVILQFSSAAGGGMPILEICKREYPEIEKVEALLNGTTNYMLGRIDAGIPYDEALREAQVKGFAEADPTDDVEGYDAAAKLRLVARLGFGADLAKEDIKLESIDGLELDASADGVVKRIGTVWKDEDGQVHASLTIQTLDKDDFIAGAYSEAARARVTLKGGKTLLIRGKGAGRWPTAESVMADLFDIRNRI